MIGRIAGRIEYRGPDHVLIDVRGVGYIVHVSDRTLAALPGVGEACALFTDLLVREDLLQLFGFPTLLEKEWHKLLMSVQGIGAKASMAILGALGAEGTARAIALGDAKAITAAPGVGPKIAQRVVMELKQKAPAVMAQAGRLSGGAAPADEDAVIEDSAPAPAKARAKSKAPAAPSDAQRRAAASADALSALVNLGYGHADAAEAVAIAAEADPASDASALIRAGLKHLAPKN